MKSSASRYAFFLQVFSCVLAGLPAPPVAAAPAQSEFSISERGPHHRVWQRVVSEQRPDGTTAQRVARYTELATGLHYKNELGLWTESQSQFELFAGGAIAREGPFQLIVSPDLTDEPTVDLQTPDAKRLQISPRWLAFFNRDTQQSSMIAAVKPCGGQLIERNVIAFMDAFDSAFAALRLTYQSWGIESDVIFLAQSDALRPEASGFDANSPGLVLEMWSEVLAWPEPMSLATNELGNGLRDVHLSFGEAHLGAGRAFSLGDEGDSIPVAKTWTQVGQRQFLIEAVRYLDVAPLLAQLPEQAQARPPGAPPAPDVRALAQRRPVAGRAGLLAQGVQRLKANEKRIQTAAIRPATASFGQGVCIDYTLLSGSITGLTLRADYTYYVNTNQTVNLYGTTVIEGGTCVKFGPGTTRLQILGTTECRTDAYRPAFFISKDDDTVGVVLANSTSTPGTNRYALAAVHLATSGTSHSLAHLRFRNAVRAVWVTTGTATFTLEHSQFGLTDYPIYSQNTGLSPVRGRNLLVHDGLYAFRGDANSSNYLEHLTAHRVYGFKAGGTVFLTNSLLISVTNSLTYTGANNVTNLDDTGFFQTVGAGARYLADGSTNRNAGTMNINPDLLAALKKKTTYPPIVIGDGTWFTDSLTLYPQAQRDTDTPDLGYHYECIDYVFSGLALTNATITAMPGVAIGTRTLGSYGLALMGGASFYCEGTPENLNCIVRYNTVQEQANTNWTEYSSGGASLMTAWTPASPAPHARIRFTEFSVPAGTEMYHLWGKQEDGGTHDVRNCQFHGGLVRSERPTLGVTNCLFNRTAISLEEAYDMNPTFRHCTFVGSDLTLAHAGSGTWTFQNNLFDATTISYTEGSFTNNYNAYTTNATRLTPTNVTDVRLSVTNIAYDNGLLGRFYLPTNLTSHSTLFDAGSAAAHTLGFYHFTAVSNQTRELTGVIDFGFHSVAVNASGQPLDTGDDDGLPDYLEDIDGDGVADAGETDWQSYNSLNGLIGSPGLQVFTPLK